MSNGLTKNPGAWQFSAAWISRFFENQIAVRRLGQEKEGMNDTKSITNESEWMRLPRPTERCPLTGLSRTSLVELIDTKDPKSGEFLIQQFTKTRHGKQRGIRMIKRASLLAFIEKRAREQCQRHFADHVNNPENYTVEQVIADYELWSLFIDAEFEVKQANWKKRSREERIECLDAMRFLKPN